MTRAGIKCNIPARGNIHLLYCYLIKLTVYHWPLTYQHIYIATPKPSQSSKFSLGALLSVPYAATAASSDPIWTRGIQARPGTSKAARDFKFDVKNHGQTQNLKISKSINLKISKSQNLKIYKSQNLKITKSINLKISKSINLKIYKSQNL